MLRMRQPNHQPMKLLLAWSAVAFVLFGASSTSTFAQGGLTPPGAPGLAFKTLTEVVVENNTVVGAFGVGTSPGYGIHMSLNTNSFLLNNRISVANFGVRMNGPNEYRDNLTSSCDTNYVAGTDRGNNF